MSAAITEHSDDTSWDALRHEADELVRCLAALVACMQQERQCVTLFDLQGLSETVREKQNLLWMLENGDSDRIRTFEQCWRDAGQTEPMPSEVPDVLAALADAPGCRDIEQWLRNTSSELLALMDVVSELQGLNRALVARALQWVNAYVTELSGGTGTYNAKGRVVNRTRGTLARSV